MAYSHRKDLNKPVHQPRLITVFLFCIYHLWYPGKSETEKVNPLISFHSCAARFEFTACTWLKVSLRTIQISVILTRLFDKCTCFNFYCLYQLFYAISNSLEKVLVKHYAPNHMPGPKGNGWYWHIYKLKIIKMLISQLTYHLLSADQISSP